MIESREKIDPSQLDLKDTVVNISRVTKVVKGGKNLSFSALVVVGDGHGVVGFGVGKAKEVPSAIKKGIEAAKKSLKSTFSGKVRGGNKAGAEALGKVIAERLKEKGVTKVVFDRGGFLYHGRIRAIADAARAAGLEF